MQTTAKRYQYKLIPSKRRDHPIKTRAQQDGYTLERVDVHGPTTTPLLNNSEQRHHSAAPTVLVRGAECYVGRNDNPSFGASVRSLPGCLLHLKRTIMQLGRSHSKSSRIRSGAPWARPDAIRYARVCAYVRRAMALTSLAAVGLRV